MIGLLEAAEVAERLAVAEMTVYRMVKSGSLPCVRVGEWLIRFDPAEVQKYIDRQTINMVAR